jgi:hypothetical protein
MHPQHPALFAIIDKYVRTRHRCFVAELDFSRSKWVMCIRPTEENTRSLGRDAYACKYISLSLEEADEVASENALELKLMERIDRDLIRLGIKCPIRAVTVQVDRPEKEMSGNAAYQDLATNRRAATSSSRLFVGSRFN